MTVVSPTCGPVRHGQPEQSDDGAMCPDDLVGGWSLVSFSIIDMDGHTLLLPMGPQPSGMLVYTADGCMSAHLLDPGRGGGRLDTCSATQTLDPSSVESVAEANAYIGYGGTYECRKDIVTHHVHISGL